MEDAAQTAEMTYLAWSVVLLLAHIVIQTLMFVKDTGLSYAASNRQGNLTVSPATERITRGLRNFVETYPAFVALAVGLVITDQAGGLGAIGASIWFWARVAYIPIFAFGIPWARTGIWTVSVIGLILMLVELF